MARIFLDHLTKVFGEVIAVDDVTLEVKDKGFVVLLGPSGCGKTTTLRCIAGLETPTKGRIYIGDADVTDLPPKDRDVAMVFQSYALYPHMKVYDNIAFPLKLRKVPKHEIDRKVKEVAELLRISELLDRRPSQLSGGQQQRVALGRAIIREPKAFLLDEPLANLDAKLRVYMRAELKSLQRELGVTTIYVTHDQVEAMTMADRIAVMNEGKILQFAEPGDLYKKPANLFVAGFIGSPSMNFIDCTLRENILDAGVFALKIPNDIRELIEKQATSSELILGIRPRDLVVYKGHRPETIEANVYVVEPLGEETILDLMLGRELFKAIVSPDFEAFPGEKVWLYIDINKAHVFDKRTEKAII